MQQRETQSGRHHSALRKKAGLSMDLALLPSACGLRVYVFVNIIAQCTVIRV